MLCARNVSEPRTIGKRQSLLIMHFLHISHKTTQWSIWISYSTKVLLSALTRSQIVFVIIIILQLIMISRSQQLRTKVSQKTLKLKYFLNELHSYRPLSLGKGKYLLPLIKHTPTAAHTHLDLNLDSRANRRVFQLKFKLFCAKK